MKRCCVGLLFLFYLILTKGVDVHAYPSNAWRHVNAGGFVVSYTKETAHLVDEVVKIARETGTVVGAYFGYDISRDRIAIVLSDHYDDTQGETYFRHDLVRLDVRKTDISLFRGETEQLRTLVSHELSHLYSLRLLKSKFYIDAGINTASDDSIGWLFTSTANTFIPEWFIEGIAQSGSYEMKADFRDPYREMLLRDAYMNKRLLSLDEMAIFEGTSREYELVYNQGFDFVLFLKNRFPQKEMKALCRTIRKDGFRDGMESFYGKSIESLYEAWVHSLPEKYEGEYDKAPGRKLFPFKKNVRTTELYSVDKGHGVIANWDHDYNRYDLHILSPDRKRIERRVADTGMIVKKDVMDGAIYFNRAVYNRGSGVDTYDIYQIKPDGALTRMTDGKRCLAFDVKNGHILYAAYKSGTTALILRYPDGLEKELILFEPDMAVSHLSMIDPESAVVSLGTGDHKRLAILKNQELTLLWRALEADVLDAVYGGEGRFFFTSTVTGSPQIFWCDMNVKPDLWYQVTNVSGGARFPSFDESRTGKPSLSFSVFENGEYKRYEVSNPFPKGNFFPVVMNETIPSVDEKEAPAPKAAPIFSKESVSRSESGANLVTRIPSVNAFYRSLDNSSDIGGGMTGLYTVGTSANLMNAPENSYELNAEINLNHPVGFKASDLTYASGDVQAGMDIHHVYLTAGFGFDRSYIEEFYSFFSDLYNTSRREFQTELSYQLFSHDFLSLSFENIRDDLSIERTFDNGAFLKKDLGVFFKTTISTLGWHHITTRSKFDPAGLGTPYFRTGAFISYHDNRYPAYEAEGEEEMEELFFSDIHYHATGVSRFGADIAHRTMLAMNRFSVKLGADGFFWEGGVRENTIAMYTYDYLGSEEYFSGYIPYLTRVRKSLRGLVEIRANPFISIFDQTRFYERCNLGLRFETGRIEYFHFGEEEKTIHAIDATFTCFFNFYKDRKSSFYVTWARPLTRIPGYQEDLDGRIYFGFLL